MIASICERKKTTKKTDLRQRLTYLLIFLTIRAHIHPEELMKIAAPPLEMHISLLDVHAMWCARKQMDFRPWETLARALIAALPVELIPFAIANGWIEKKGRRDLWCLPEFLSCLVYYTEHGIGNQVYVKPNLIRANAVHKDDGRKKYTSLAEMMRTLEGAWQNQFLIIVEEPQENRTRKAEFCVSFYAANVAVCEDFFIPAERHVLH